MTQTQAILTLAEIAKTALGNNTVQLAYHEACAQALAEIDPDAAEHSRAVVAALRAADEAQAKFWQRIESRPARR